jgi:hypothetical protein
MKKNIFFLTVIAIAMFFSPAFAQENTEDYPLLSQGMLAPPPPPPGYAEPVPDFVPDARQMPAPPMLPQGSVPPSAQFKDNYVSVKGPEVKMVQAVSKELYERMKQVMRAIHTFRTVSDKPTNGDQLRRIQNLGKSCNELLELTQYPPLSRFVPSHSDKVIRDRSFGTVEYRHFGDFDQRLNGYIKPINNAIFADVVFTGRGRRRTHVRAQVSRNGTLEGHFYAYTWDKYGRNWKLQGTMENLLCYDNGLPYTGELKVYGADPAGKTVGLALKFPVKVMGIAEPNKKEIRHREGKPVHIGN